MTDLFTHWIDVVHWAMKSDQPRDVQMLGDKYIYEQWDRPDTVQAALRYPGFDVVYEGMMGSSIDDGGLEFRGTEATLKINRSGFGVYHEGVAGKENPVVRAESFQDGTIRSRTCRISSIASRLARNPTRRSKPEWPQREQDRSPTWHTAAAVRSRGL
jgi:predicted dehydrogenase